MDVITDPSANRIKHLLEKRAYQKTMDLFTDPCANFSKHLLLKGVSGRDLTNFQ